MADARQKNSRVNSETTISTKLEIYCAENCPALL
jgi:hypothetical protein